MLGFALDSAMDSEDNLSAFFIYKTLVGERVVMQIVDLKNVL